MNKDKVDFIKKTLEEKFGWSVDNESWYDEEGVEGTAIYDENSVDVASDMGWNDECDLFNELVYKILKKIE